MLAEINKTMTIFELIKTILSNNNIDYTQEGQTMLVFNDQEEPEEWGTLTALAMAMQQAAGTDNGLVKAISGENTEIINDILTGSVKVTAGG